MLGGFEIEGPRAGKAHSGIFQPDLYRVPEAVLGMNWASKVDIGTLEHW